ncbi:hypothetical protein [Streptomyces sp. NPDC057002]|uniref:hypothetical protein n=1 Tax=Streptomyces sp. NPDC057002 TaxID=3345992 RepID=UPI00363E0B55
MSRRHSPTGAQVAESHLIVPRVEDDDVGLVVEVRGVQWDSHSRRWWVLLAEQRMYRLPVELSDWARKLDHDARRRFLTLPKVVAFRESGGRTTARVLSAT